MDDFIYKWKVLFIGIFNNIIRNLAIIKNKKSKKSSEDYYKNLDALQDAFVDSLPSKKKAQVEFVKDIGRSRYLLDVLFFDHILKNNMYDNVVDFGTGNGQLASVLACYNSDKEFFLYDIIPNTYKLNAKYLIPNMHFIESKYNPCDSVMKSKKNSICIARMSMAYLNYSELKKILLCLYENNIDIAISDVGRFRLNKVSKVSYTQSGMPVYSHPYVKLLTEIGYKVELNMQNSQPLMNLTTYIFPEYHVMIHAVV
jgi:hypothetical protein